MEFQERVKEYADTVKCSQELAERRIKCFDKIEEIIRAAKVCPNCGKSTLEYQIGDYEEGTQDFVYCDNEEGSLKVDEEDGEEYFEECGYRAEPEKKHEPLQIWFDFDYVLAIASDIGTTHKEFDGVSWEDFILRETKNMERELFPTE